MSIKEKLEKAKEKAKRRVRKAAVGAALVGTLGAGAVSCGEANIKDKQDNAKNIVEDKTSNNTITVSNKDDFLFEKKVHGFPLRKHAKDTNDPDSLLVEVAPAGSANLGGEVNYENKAEYVPVKPEDRDSEFYITDISDKMRPFEGMTPGTKYKPNRDDVAKMNPKSTRLYYGVKAKTTDIDAGFDGNIDNATLEGLPLKKQAKNPNDPDSLLVKVTSKYKKSETEITDFNKEAKYVAIDPHDKNKKIEPKYEGESFHVEGTEIDIVGYNQYHSTSYGENGREEVNFKTPIVKEKLKVKKTKTVSYSVKDKER